MKPRPRANASSKQALTKQDRELIAAAGAAIKARYRNDWQEVGAAMRTRDGRIVTGVNIDAYIGRIAVCAEAIAIGRAITETGDKGIETIVAVRQLPRADLGLRSQRPRHSARRERPDHHLDQRAVAQQVPA